MSDFILNGTPGLTEVWSSIMTTNIYSQLYLTLNWLVSPSCRPLSQKKEKKSNIPAGLARAGMFPERHGLSDAEYWLLLYSCPVIRSKKATQWAIECCKRSSWTTYLSAHWSSPVFFTHLLLLFMGFIRWTEGRVAWWGLYSSESCQFKFAHGSRLTHNWPLAVLNISWSARGKLPGLRRSWIKRTHLPRTFIDVNESHCDLVWLSKKNILSQYFFSQRAVIFRKQSLDLKKREYRSNWTSQSVPEREKYHESCSSKHRWFSSLSDKRFNNVMLPGNGCTFAKYCLVTKIVSKE